MAKKAETPNMVERFAEFKELKNIDKETMIGVLEDSFRKVLAQDSMFKTDQNIDVILNPDKGDVQIFQNLEVVPDGMVTAPNLQISLSDARADGNPYAEVGEEHTREIFFTDFGRRALLALRQILQGRILELQKESIYNKFKELEGQIITTEVYQAWSRETLLVDSEKHEVLLPKDQAIPGEYFRKGETVRVVVDHIDKNSNKVYVSRTSNEFLRRLFELEVPEIHDGLINICAVARIPGERAKIAVESYDERIDPVGACVGIKGSRIHGIVRELNNENIDVITYTTDSRLFIQRALSPARISSIRVSEGDRKAEVFVHPDEISLAIGKGGLNIKLASKLTGYDIEVYRDSDQVYDEDIFLDAFRNDIDDWIIDALKDIGCLTAKSVLNTPRQDLIDRADLEEETIDEVLKVIRAEYDDLEAEAEINTDIDIDDFRDTFDDWIIDEVKKAGYNTARELVVYTPRKRLEERLDFEDETLDELIRVVTERYENALKAAQDDAKAREEDNDTDAVPAADEPGEADAESPVEEPAEQDATEVADEKKSSPKATKK